MCKYYPDVKCVCCNLECDHNCSIDDELEEEIEDKLEEFIFSWDLDSFDKYEKEIKIDE